MAIEADIQGISLDRDRSFTTFGFTGPVPVGFQPFRDDVSSLDYFGTIRARLGYAWDRTLVYATGGFAYGGGDNHSDCRDRFGGAAFGGGAFCSGGSDDTRWGYAVGGGVEWALPTTMSLFGSSAMTFKIEGLYVNLDEDDSSGRRDVVGFTSGGTAIINGGAATGADVRGRHNETDFGLVRAGINLKF